MGAKSRRFADDGWAIWIDGDDRSTVYLNEWINPHGKSFVDIGIRIYGAKGARELNVYVPFEIAREDVRDLSGMLSDRDTLRALFNTNGIIDAEKNQYTSELKYDGRIVSLINLSESFVNEERLADGTVINVSLESIQEYITADEAYIIFRIPHKSLDEIFSPKIDVGGLIDKLNELITTPIVTREYGYSIRINEARLLPPEINRIDTLQQQRIRKALVTISLDESFTLNDSNCYRIRRLEEDLYKDYAPPDYNCSDAITYQWVEERDKNMKAHYNFYFDIVHNSISRKSMLVYLLLVLIIGALGGAVWDFIKMLAGLLL